MNSLKLLKEYMGKVKELPYNQGYDCAKAGGRTKENPYWDCYENQNEWAFHSWLHGWSDYTTEQELKKRNQGG